MNSSRLMALLGLLAPHTLSLRLTPPCQANLKASTSLSVGRRAWAASSTLGLSVAVWALTPAMAAVVEAEKGALKSLKRQVELKRRPLPLLARKKMEQVSNAHVMRTTTLLLLYLLVFLF